MGTAVGKSGWESGSRRRSPVRRVLLLACLALLVAVPGCGGCLKTTPKDKKDAEETLAERNERLRKLKPKPNYEFGFQGDDPEKSNLGSGLLMAAQPHESKPRRLLVKPGHWTAATLPAKANTALRLRLKESDQ